jgi:hypothetical protein
MTRTPIGMVTNLAGLDGPPIAQLGLLPVEPHEIGPGAAQLLTTPLLKPSIKNCWRLTQLG